MIYPVKNWFDYTPVIARAKKAGRLWLRGCAARAATHIRALVKPIRIKMNWFDDNQN